MDEKIREKSFAALIIIGSIKAWKSETKGEKVKMRRQKNISAEYCLCHDD